MQQWLLEYNESNLEDTSSCVTALSAPSVSAKEIALKVNLLVTLIQLRPSIAVFRFSVIRHMGVSALPAPHHMDGINGGNHI
jgi:hypothetical protein